MAFKKWCVADFDKQLAKELAAECDVDPIVALIASSVRTHRRGRLRL